MLETSFNVRWSWYPSLSEAHLDVPKIIGNRWPFSRHFSPLWNLQVQQQNDQVTVFFLFKWPSINDQLDLFVATFFPVFFSLSHRGIRSYVVARSQRRIDSLHKWPITATWLGALEKKTYCRLLGGGNSNMFCFTPKIGEYVQFDEHIFQMGWNHQPD